MRWVVYNSAYWNVSKQKMKHVLRWSIYLEFLGNWSHTKARLHAVASVVGTIVFCLWLKHTAWHSLGLVWRDFHLAGYDIFIIISKLKPALFSFCLLSFFMKVVGLLTLRWGGGNQKKIGNPMVPNVNLRFLQNHCDNLPFKSKLWSADNTKHHFVMNFCWITHIPVT